MANRFTDTAKWSKAWFCSLTPQLKIFWIYLCDNCNNGGIWNVNWPLVKFHTWIEEPVDVNVFGGRVREITTDKWFLEEFVLFQQKINTIDELNPANKAHLEIIRILTKEKIISPIEGASEGLQSPPGIGKVKVKVKEGGVGETRGFKPPALTDVLAYCQERKNHVDPQRWHDFYSAKGWMVGKNKMKDWRAAVRTWEKDSHPTKDTSDIDKIAEMARKK